jgi:hypothetical protein
VLSQSKKKRFRDNIYELLITQCAQSANFA